MFWVHKRNDLMSHLSSFDRQSVVDFARKFEDLFYEGDGIAKGRPNIIPKMPDSWRRDIDAIQGKAGIESFWQATCARGKILHTKRKIIVDDIEMSPGIKLRRLYAHPSISNTRWQDRR